MNTGTARLSQPAPAAHEARVLLVDDDRELCQMLTEYLEAEHFEVRACMTAAMRSRSSR